MNGITNFFKVVFGGIITAVSGFLGGMDGVMYALLAFISIDYITGVAVAVKQKKLSSEVGFWGLVRKVCILILVGISNFIDRNVMGTGDVFRTAVAMYYIGNEGISLLENIGNLGVTLPKKLVEVLKQISKDGENSENAKSKEKENNKDE